MVLSLSPFWVESIYSPPYPYYMVLSLSSFWVESLCSYPYVYTIVTFLQALLNTLHSSSNDSNGISRTISLFKMFLMSIIFTLHSMEAINIVL